MQRKTNTIGRAARLTIAGTLATATLLGTSACNNAGEGAVSGAGLGAVAGLAIGSLSGDAGKGAIIGAVAGGVGGAVIGDQNERKDKRARDADDRYYDNYDRYDD